MRPLSSDRYWADYGCGQLICVCGLDEYNVSFALDGEVREPVIIVEEDGQSASPMLPEGIQFDF